MNALDLMTPRPHVVRPADPVLRAAEIMRDHDVGAVPVVDGHGTRVLVGVITDRDLAVRHVAAAHHHDCPVAAHMSPGPLVTVRPDAGVREVMRRMRHGKVRRVMVTDARGVLLGVVAQADLARLEGGEDPVAVERVLEAVSEPACLPR